MRRVKKMWVMTRVLPPATLRQPSGLENRRCRLPAFVRGLWQRAKQVPDVNRQNQDLLNDVRGLTTAATKARFTGGGSAGRWSGPASR